LTPIMDKHSNISMSITFYSAADVRASHEAEKKYLFRSIKEASEAAGGDDNLARLIGIDSAKMKKDLDRGSFSGMLRVLEAIENRNKR